MEGWALSRAIILGTTSRDCGIPPIHKTRNCVSSSGGSGRLPGNMPEGFDALRLLPASTPESFGTITVQPANMSEVAGNNSGFPEKMPGNSDHPPAFHSGRPKNFAGISARRFSGVEHQRFSVVGERRTGVIATGVLGGADS